MDAFTAHRYEGCDGADLYARHYDNKAALHTVLCLHGLTRNSADFAALAECLSSEYSVIVPDQRGRGESAWSATETYNPAVYVQDMWKLLDYFGLDCVILIGTSMGGLMSMIMAAERPDRVEAVVLNDVGPEIDPKGLQRIQSYIGTGMEPIRFELALESLRTMNKAVFPDYKDHDWAHFTRKLYRQVDAEHWRLNYDPDIATAIADAASNAVPPDLWSLYGALKPLPLLLLRGENSDILSPECFLKMANLHPAARAVTILNRGHAPMLDEPDSLAAIEGFLRTLS